MRRFAVVGNPIAHSKSPVIHAGFAEQCGHQIDYQKILVEPGEFDAVVTAFFDQGGAGLNVTAPFKEEAFNVAAVRTEAAEDAKAANTLWLDARGQVCAHNTDGSGLLRDLEVNLAWSIDGANVLVLGAGGAMRGVLGAFCERAPATVHVANRTVEKAEQLAALLAGKVALSTSGLQNIPDSPWDIVINGLSSGWAGDFPDLVVPNLAPSGAAYDLLYSNEPTPFMRWAQMRGVEHVSDGLGMLVEQAADSYVVWHSQRPETAEVTSRLRGV